MSEQTWSTEQVRKMTGITNKALEHYDKKGLLVPRKRNTGRRMYREYTRDDIRKLYLIQLYQQLGYKLKEIEEILDDPSFDIGKSLRELKSALEKRILQATGQLATVDYLIKRVSGADDLEHEAGMLLLRYPEQRWVLRLYDTPDSPETMGLINDLLEKGEQYRKASVEAMDKLYDDYIETGHLLSEDEITEFMMPRMMQPLMPKQGLPTEKVLIKVLFDLVAAKSSGCAPESEQTQTALQGAQEELAASGATDPEGELIQFAQRIQIMAGTEFAQQVWEINGIEGSMDDISSFLVSAMLIGMPERFEIVAQEESE